MRPAQLGLAAGALMLTGVLLPLPPGGVRLGLFLIGASVLALLLLQVAIELARETRR